MFNGQLSWESGEYDLYLKIVQTGYSIMYHPGLVANFAIHDQGQLSRDPANLNQIGEGEFLIFQKFFSKRNLPSSIKCLEKEASG